MTEAYTLSKRWIANFGEKDHTRQNIEFFRNTLNVEPVVLMFWYKRKLSGFVVGEPGLKAWDITEAHLSISGGWAKPGDDEVTSLSAKKWLELDEKVPESWYKHWITNEDPLPGERVWEPFDKNRGIHGYVDGVYKST